MTRVLIVEDSRTVRSYVERILRSAPDIELLSPAADGATGVSIAIAERPDVILMDLDLPVLDGLTAIREIMATAPRPIVVLSGLLDAPERNRTLEAFQAGAVEVMAKPRGLSMDDITQFGERLLRMVRVMSDARVLRRKSNRMPPSRRFGRDASLALSSLEVVLIGASTGGPLVVREILKGIEPPFPLPIVLCQHILPGFEGEMAAWLGATGHRVAVVRPGDRATAGTVHVAPGGHNVMLCGRQFVLSPREASLPAPAVDVLFESGASSFGRGCLALLLTGMGEDGKRGMLSLRRRGAVTITQTAETCVINGMPAAARAAGASGGDLSPTEMSELLRQVAITVIGAKEKGT